MVNRSMLRAAAKREYKKQMKNSNVPKSKRMPFSEFFKQYIKLQASLKTAEAPEVETDNEDFDFEDMVNLTEISDDDVEIQETS